VESKWKNYHIITFLDSLSPKTLSLEEAMDLSRDRNEMNDEGKKDRRTQIYEMHVFVITSSVLQTSLKMV
jgi:hypothetical protein